MAEFQLAFNRTLTAEGGYRLTNVAGDRGGQTYAGISRVNHSAWPGWALIDSGDHASPTLKRLVADFYHANFWVPLRGEILPQETAESIYDFAVNAGVKPAVMAAQRAVDASPDGLIGPNTLRRLGLTDADEFRRCFTLERIAYYAAICNRAKGQSKFLLGWINRALADLAA